MLRCLAVLGSLVLLGSSLLALSAPPANADYPEIGYVLDLGTLGGERSAALDANGNGLIVGWAERDRRDLSDDPVRRAFIWDRERGMQDLGTFGGFHSEALGINARGEVVGWAEKASGPSLPFIWSRQRGMRALPLPAGDVYGGRATDINDRGEISGSYYTGRAELPCYWKNGRVFPLPGGISEGRALAIGRDGRVAGSAIRGDRGWARGFLWKPMKVLDPGRVQAIQNSRNYTLIRYGDMGDTSLSWIRNGAETPLPPLPNTRAEALAIADDRVEGTCWNPSNPDPTQQRACRWTEAGVMDLNNHVRWDSGWVLQASYGLHIGYGLHNGVQRAYLIKYSEHD